MTSLFIPEELIQEELAGFATPRDIVQFGRESLQFGGNVVNWFESALALLGDIVDPFLPGFAGSELRATSSTVNLAGINRARAASGLPPLGGRRRRKRALTLSDRADIAFISGTLGKPAGRDFAMIVAARSG